MAEPKATEEAPETDPDDKNKATDVVTEEPKGEDTPKGDDPKAKEEPKAKAKADGLPELPPGYTVISDEMLAELTAGAEAGKAAAGELAEQKADDFADKLVTAGKALPTEKDRIVAEYKENPTLVRSIYDRIKEGAAAPVGQLSTFSRGAVATEPTGDLPPSAIRYSAAERERLGLNQEA